MIEEEPILADKDSQHGVEDFTRIFLRPLASPLPLAFFAFGLGSAIQSALQLGLIPQQESGNVTLIFGAFVFLPMALAALFAFLTRETLGTTLLSLLSFSWLSNALVTYASAPNPTSSALGVLNVVVAVVLLLLSATAVLGKPILAALITLATARYCTNGLYELPTSTGLQTASGIIGLVIFAISLYAGLAFGIEGVQHHTVLPLGRRGEAAEAFEGNLSEQVGPVEQEAGIRKQL
jgi:succinate-acetate transporter protein